MFEVEELFQLRRDGRNWRERSRSEESAALISGPDTGYTRQVYYELIN